MIGAEGAIGGFTVLAEWRAPASEPPKDRDFALGLGPVVVTPDEFEPAALASGCDAGDARRPSCRRLRLGGRLALAARRTSLRPGDVLAGAAAARARRTSARVELEVDGIGVLEQRRRLA